jgi:hypothetical protein
MLLSARIALAACKISVSPRHNLALFVLSLDCDIGRSRNGNLAALNGVLKLKGRIALNKLSPLS